MDKRTRSPNYPALSLPQAIERAGLIYRNQHTHAAPREVVVKSMGFAGINGASATAYSALLKYGLLDRHGEDAKLSERAMSILHPNSGEERQQAIRDAASDPVLFQELSERFPGRLPVEEVLRNYLIRKNFAPAALPTVILAYRETMDLVESEVGTFDSPHTSAVESTEFTTSQSHDILPGGVSYLGIPTVNQKDERSIGRHDFEDGSYVRVVASADLDTDLALTWVEILVENKRRELTMLTRRVPVVIKKAGKSDDSGERDA
jgi:hypothetical protein